MDVVTLEMLAIYSIIAAGVLVPIFGLTARLALKPIVDAIIRLREASPSAHDSATAQLAAEVQRLSEELARLQTEVAFDRTLLRPQQAQPSALSRPPHTGTTDSHA